MTTQSTKLNTPWSLHFDRDGTEDIAVILNADGEELAYSRAFWLPEGDAPIPPTPAAIRLMAVAPKLTAATEQPETENPEQTQSFVERIRQQRGWNVASDPFGIAGDYVAGVRLFENRKDRLMAIKFEDKPGQAVRDLVKDAGYRWNSRDMVWTHLIEEDSARTTRIEAERLYQEVRDMVRHEKGIEGWQEVPF